MRILQMIYHMQIYAEINFIRGYLSLSLSRSVGGGGKNLNELFCLLSSHHLNSFVFQVSVRWENHTSPVFCLQLLSFNPSYQYTDGHELSP